MRCCWSLISPKLSPWVSSVSLTSHGFEEPWPAPPPSAMRVDLWDRVVTSKNQLPCLWTIKKNKMRIEQKASRVYEASKQIRQKGDKIWKVGIKFFFFFFTSQSHCHHTHKALIAHQCLLTISKHRLGWIYTVTLDVHLYRSWGGGHTHICIRHVPFSMLRPFEHCMTTKPWRSQDQGGYLFTSIVF